MKVCKFGCLHATSLAAGMFRTQLLYYLLLCNSQKKVSQQQLSFITKKQNSDKEDYRNYIR